MAQTLPNISSFLENRTPSAQELSALLRQLDPEKPAPAAVGQLHHLADELSQRGPVEKGLWLHTVAVPGEEEPMRLFLHPAVFAPERWGQTFAEGLLKDVNLFSQSKVVELGTGSGWISLLMLRKTNVRKILGLDINPVAVEIARLNAWLNGTTRDGILKLSAAGIPMVQAFSAAVSDLLGEPMSRNARFDHVIGCIPQVLHPDPSSLSIKKKLSTQDLYDLSNYCFEQGILEDRFGLPLIARALEEAQLCLNPNGSLTLIIGGRPGPEAIESMFRRRGYEPSVWWSRRIEQADDTDLASLVELERLHRIQFHFFSSMSSKSSISASTAVRFLSKDKPIFHDLLVYRAHTRAEKPTFGFVRNLHAMGMSSLRRELDFSRVSEEQISFVERLTAELLQNKTMPYPHERGDLRFRQKLSRFLRVYCRYECSPEYLFVGPERSQLVRLVASMIGSTGDRVLLSGSVEPVYRADLERLGLDVIVGNDDLSELFEMDDTFAPAVSVISPHQMQDPSPLVLDAFVAHAKKHPDRFYVIDDSANFEIGSDLKSNVMMRILAERDLPPNLVFLYGLIKNTVFPDFELSFMINAPKSWVHGLDVAAELTYSRIAYPVQLYYEWLFDELLAFPFSQDAAETECNPADGPGLIPAFRSIADDPAFAAKPVDPEAPDVVRFDYGELEAPIPDLLTRGLLKGCLERSRADVRSRMDVHDLVISRVCSYLDFTRGCKATADQIVLGQGVFPLLAAFVEVLTRRLGRNPVIAIPQGGYGLIYPLVRYHGAQLVEIPTDAKTGFLPTVQAIAQLKEKPDVLWLTQPNNPTGLYLDVDTVSGIMQLCAERDIFVLADEIFFLLSQSELGEWTPAQLSLAHSTHGGHKKIFLVDGLSKAFAAGGLRCGFMMCPDVQWKNDIAKIVELPPRAILRAADELYSAFEEEAPHSMINIPAVRNDVKEYLMNVRTRLDAQRNALLELLRSHGIADGAIDGKRGGLFLLAKLEDRSKVLALRQKLLVNPPDWTRAAGWSRISFSVTDEKFTEGFRRLSEFLGST